MWLFKIYTCKSCQQSISSDFPTFWNGRAFKKFITFRSGVVVEECVVVPVFTAQKRRVAFEKIHYWQYNFDGGEWREHVFWGRTGNADASYGFV